MENNFLSNTSILTILIIFILGFIFQLFENIFRKRVNEISIDTDQHLMKINYYSLIEGNVQRKLLYENMVFQIKESTDSSFKIYNKNKREEPPISISIYKDGFNKTTFKELIDLLIILTKAVSK